LGQHAWQVAATTRRHGRTGATRVRVRGAQQSRFGSRGQRAFDGLAALAEALDIRYEFNGLETSIGRDAAGGLFATIRPAAATCLADASAGEPVSRLSDSRKSAHEVSALDVGENDSGRPVFASSAALNLDSMMKLRREFGTQIPGPGVFQREFRRRCSSTALSRTANGATHSSGSRAIHDALLVPVFFSGRNRLRYYLARGSAGARISGLAVGVPQLAGQSMTARSGKPIDPDMLRAIPDRRDQLSFLARQRL